MDQNQMTKLNKLNSIEEPADEGFQPENNAAALMGTGEEATAPIQFQGEKPMNHGPATSQAQVAEAGRSTPQQNSATEVKSPLPLRLDEPSQYTCTLSSDEEEEDISEDNYSVSGAASTTPSPKKNTKKKLRNRLRFRHKVFEGMSGLEKVLEYFSVLVADKLVGTLVTDATCAIAIGEVIADMGFPACKASAIALDVNKFFDAAIRNNTQSQDNTLVIQPFHLRVADQLDANQRAERIFMLNKMYMAVKFESSLEEWEASNALTKSESEKQKFYECLKAASDRLTQEVDANHEKEKKEKLTDSKKIIKQLLLSSCSGGGASAGVADKTVATAGGVGDDTSMDFNGNRRELLSESLSPKEGTELDPSETATEDSFPLWV
ncbi:uncharacterized protein LOC117590245 [Drosophila guanche]|uniref:Uncharacterized protein n=1 Tax=Drosophila guanche TaxID=7266 RepID=A0A3B0K346_DROGU|nr:uncharacterized protein LOC117590245 [Drosophila guanche]SPP88695.1 Hypothetical predicted protein [Drosophila guanche]